MYQCPQCAHRSFRLTGTVAVEACITIEALEHGDLVVEEDWVDTAPPDPHDYEAAVLACRACHWRGALDEAAAAGHAAADEDGAQLPLLPEA